MPRQLARHRSAWPPRRGGQWRVAGTPDTGSTSSRVSLSRPSRSNPARTVAWSASPTTVSAIPLAIFSSASVAWAAPSSIFIPIVHPSVCSSGGNVTARSI
ncbi:hypothetical protein G6F22_020964 [Rhizopus arrhizus]|nr:hypothetical protein G6F22_020964 [Rhizopus arrhizus]